MPSTPYWSWMTMREIWRSSAICCARTTTSSPRRRASWTRSRPRRKASNSARRTTSPSPTGRLDAAEWTVMKTHARLGALAIERAVREAGHSVGFLDIARQITQSHHDKWEPFRSRGGGRLPRRVQRIRRRCRTLHRRRRHDRSCAVAALNAHLLFALERGKYSCYPACYVVIQQGGDHAKHPDRTAIREGGAKP